MDSSVEEILRKMGWTTGLHLPVANDNNKALQNEIETLMLRKAKATQFYQTEIDRYNSITEHLKYVKMQNDENQKLLATYKQHLESQEHKFLSTRSEKERVHQEIRQTEKKNADVNDRISIKQQDLDRGLMRMEKIKVETSWDNEALQAWEESLKKRDEDNELLKQFSKEDEKKAKEFEMKRQNLQVEVTNQRHILDKAIADVVSYEQIIHRTDKMIKQQKEELAALVRQWKEAVKTLKFRDEGIDRAIKDTAMTLELISEQQERLDEQNKFLNIERDNNKEIEQQIEELNVEGSRLRRQLTELIQYVLTLTNEVNTLKKTVIASANCLEKERGGGRNLTRDISEKEHKIKQSEMEIRDLERKYDNIKNNSASAADRASQLEQIIETEQKQTRILDGDVEKMQGALYRTQQQLNELKNITKTKDMEIHSSENSITLLQKHAQRLCKELQKQKEINYDLDFRRNQMQVRLDKLEGNIIDDDEDAKLTKIEDLKQALAEETELSTMLQTQINQIEEEMRRLSTAIQSDNTQLDTLQDKLQNELLSFEGGTKQSLIAKQTSQQKQVDENILRLRVNQLENIMKRESNNIWNLQRFRLELETAMRERQIEITTNREVLVAKRRNMDEEKGRLKRDIMARHIKIDQLQKRFHIAMSVLGKDEDGQPLNVTHFKIKNAQEKYMLQEEGDQLDAKIQKAEREIVAMENTLGLVNNANNTYKRSLSAVEEYDEEVQEMQVLEKEISTITSLVRGKKRQLTNKKTHVKDLKTYLTTANEERTQTHQELEVVTEEYEDLQKRILQQMEKIERTQRHLCSTMKHITPGKIDKYKGNLLIQQLHEGNKAALQQLAEVSVRYQEITPQVARYMSDHELEMPSSLRTRSTPSSSSNSSRSSEYYASGPPYVSNVCLTFDSVTKGENKNSGKTQIKQKPKSKH